MTNTDKKVQALYSTFVFIGDAMFNEEKYYTSKVSDSGYKYSKIQFGVKTHEGNVAYTEMMGGFSTVNKNTIYAMDKDKNKMEIDFNDRLDQAIIDTVADFKKIKMNFTSSEEKDAKVFISEYDAVEHIKANLKKGQRIVVIGNVSVERYEDKNGKKTTNIKYIPTKIRLAKEDEKNKAEVTLSFVFDKESVETDRLVSEGKIDVTAYFTTYNKPSKGNIFVPYPLVVDMNYLTSISTVQLDDAKKEMLTNMYKNYFKADSGEYYETQWKAELFRGSMKEEITMEDLTDDQKLQIEFGVVTFEQLQKEMGGKNGDKINELKLIRPTNKFEDEKLGLQVNKLTTYVEEDFYIPEVKVEDKNTVYNNTTPQGNTDANGVGELKALFG